MVGEGGSRSESWDDGEREREREREKGEGDGEGWGRRVEGGAERALLLGSLGL